MASRNAVIAMGLALWCLGRAPVAGAGSAQVIEVGRSHGDKAEVLLNAGRREGLALDAQVNLLRPGSPIVHPLTGQELGRPQEPVGVARVFEAGDHQSRAVVEKSYTETQVGDEAEFAPAAAQEPAAAGQGHEAAGKAGGTAPAEEHGRAGDAEMQQRLRDLERSVEEYHSSSKTLKAYPAFAQRVWDEISTMKSYLVSLDERLVQLEEQQSQERHPLGAPGDGAGEEGMREFTVRYAPDTQVRLKVAGKTLLISVERDSLRVEEEGAAPAAMAGEHQAEEEHGSAPVHERAGEEAPGAGEGHGAAALGEEGHEAQLPWYQSPWVLGSGVLALGLVAGVISWLIKRRYEEESEELEADYLEEEEEEEDEEED
jgi:hypothetical protein